MHALPLLLLLGVAPPSELASTPAPPTAVSQAGRIAVLLTAGLVTESLGLGLFVLGGVPFGPPAALKVTSMVVGSAVIGLGVGVVVGGVGNAMGGNGSIGVAIGGNAAGALLGAGVAVTYFSLALRSSPVSPQLYGWSIAVIALASVLPTVGAVLAYELTTQPRAAPPASTRSAWEEHRIRFGAAPVLTAERSSVNGAALTVSGQF